MAQVVVGTSCAEGRHMLDISYPVSNGQVQDWDAMARVWDHTFEHVLKLDAAARARTNILLTEPPLNPLVNRQDTELIMQCPAWAQHHYFAKQITSSLVQVLTCPCCRYPESSLIRGICL